MNYYEDSAQARREAELLREGTKLITVISCTACDYTARFESRDLAQSAANMHKTLGSKHEIRAHVEEAR